METLLTNINLEEIIPINNELNSESCEVITGFMEGNCIRIGFVSAMIDMMCELIQKDKLSVEEKKLLYKKIFS